MQGEDPTNHHAISRSAQPPQPPANQQHNIDSDGHISIFRSSPLLPRIHADDQDKKTICLFWSLLFVFVIIIAIFANFAIPDLYTKVINSKELQGTNLNNCINPANITNNQVVCATFANSSTYLGEYVKSWTPANQFGLLYLQIIPTNINTVICTNPNNIAINQQYTFQLYNINQVYVPIDHNNHLMIKQKTTTLKIALNTVLNLNENALYGEDKKTQIGYLYPLVILTKLDDGQPILMRVKFQNVHDFDAATSVNLQSYAINPQFTYFTIILRYVFFGLSILSCVLYFIRFIKMPADQRIIEQKMIAVGSVLLIMFNDPFYPITVLKPNGGSAFFSILFVVNFMVFLVLFWLVTADRIAFQDGLKQSQQLTKKKIAFAVLFWIQLIVCLMIYTMNQINDSPVLSGGFLNKFTAARVIITLTVVAAILYIGYRYSQVCCAPDGKLWRNYIFMIFSSIFIFAFFIIVASNSLVVYSYNGQTILLVYGLLNIYIYYLQYMFTITLQQIQKLQMSHGPNQQQNFEMMTNGTIDIVDVDLSSDYEKMPRKSQELVEKEEDSQMQHNKKKDNQFQSFQFD